MRLNEVRALSASCESRKVHVYEHVRTCTSTSTTFCRREHNEERIGTRSGFGGERVRWVSAATARGSRILRRRRRRKAEVVECGRYGYSSRVELRNIRNPFPIRKSASSHSTGSHHPSVARYLR